MRDSGSIETISPALSDVHGWNAENCHDFSISEHLLIPNNLSDKSIFEVANHNQTSKLRIKGPDGSLSEEREFIWKVTPPNGKPGVVVALLQAANPINKKYYFQARNLPGFLHNLSQPLGTIIGRIELLQHQHPNIRGLETLIRVSNTMQNMVHNISSKVNCEGEKGLQAIHLNRLLHEELEFLKSDPFFKHQVEATFEMDRQVPQFNSNYAAFTGVLQECYYLIRSHTERFNRYTMHVTSFRETDKVGFTITFKGQFFPNGQPLPLEITADAETINQQSPIRLDPKFLSHCMKQHQGNLSILGTTENFHLTYEFPLP